MAEERKDLDDLKQILRYGSDEELRDFLSLLHPADLADLIAVSYTHLTLPTILLV